MANNYTSSSAVMAIPKGKEKLAQEIIDRVAEQYENDPEEGYFGALVSIVEEGVWMRHDESVTVEHMVALSQELLDGLEIDEPFEISWAYTCSKARPGEFGGGACIVRRGKESVWVDAVHTAQQLVAEEGESKIMQTNLEDLSARELIENAAALLIDDMAYTDKRIPSPDDEDEGVYCFYLPEETWEVMVAAKEIMKAVPGEDLEIRVPSLSGDVIIITPLFTHTTNQTK